MHLPSVMRTTALTLLALVLLAPGIARAQSPASPPAAADPTAAESLIRRYVDAFNRHDVDATVGCVDTSFRWYNIAADSMQLTMAGRDTQRSGLARYFKAFADVHSDISALAVNGPWVMVREQVRWTGAKGRAENIALAVYEVRENLIRRVYYFPAERRSLATGDTR